VLPIVLSQKLLERLRTFVIDSGSGHMPLYAFRVLTTEGAAGMELGFSGDEAAIT
jgi:hypothetical protein